MLIVKVFTNAILLLLVKALTSVSFHQNQIKERDHTRPCGMDDNAKYVLAQASYLSKAHIFQWPAEYMRNKWDNIGNIPV